MYRPTGNICSNKRSKRFSKDTVIVYTNKINVCYLRHGIVEKKQLTRREVTLNYAHESQPFQDVCHIY
jgi:hypothetical protein